MNNQFLSSFMKMRASMAEKAPPAPPAKGASSISHMPEPEIGEITLRGIIEEKPPAKEVLKFFKERVKKLNREDDDE